MAMQVIRIETVGLIITLMFSCSAFADTYVKKRTVKGELNWFSVAGDPRAGWDINGFDHPVLEINLIQNGARFGSSQSHSVQRFYANSLESSRDYYEAISLLQGLFIMSPVRFWEIQWETPENTLYWGGMLQLQVQPPGYNYPYY